MDSHLEELMVDRAGIFLREERGGSAVTAVPVARPITVPVDRLGNPHHNQRVLDNLYHAHPSEYRGFTKGVVHDGRVPIVYFRYKVGVHICAQPENYVTGTIERVEQVH